MLLLDINNIPQLNEIFCELVGIKPIRGMLINKDTKEIRLYTSLSCYYRHPKGWENSEVVIFSRSQFPDFTSEHNFNILINLQWELFGTLGDQYIKIKDESLAVNYLYTKTKALQTLKSYGGSEMMAEFCRRVRESNYEYCIIKEREQDDQFTCYSE